jgi:penicillin-binding protein 1A
MPPHPQRIIASQHDRDLVAMLWNVVTSGTGTSASLSPREAAGKTGTTQNSQDAWFVGFTTDYVAGVWVGNDDNSATRGVTGGTLPAQIWKSAMLTAEKGLPMKPLDRSPPQPANEPALLASGASGDEESPGAAVQEERPHEAEPERRGWGEGILGWLFGGDDDRRPPPPPPPPPPPSAYSRPPYETPPPPPGYARTPYGPAPYPPPGYDR